MDYSNDDFSLPMGFWIFIIAFIVFIYAAMWKVFVKAGREGWEAIIPIYNLYIMTKIGGKPGWWVIMFFLPIVNLIFSIWLYNMISKSFGKSGKALRSGWFYWGLFSGQYLVLEMQNTLDLMVTLLHFRLMATRINLILKINNKWHKY